MIPRPPGSSTAAPGPGDRRDPRWIDPPFLLESFAIPVVAGPAERRTGRDAQGRRAISKKVFVGNLSFDVSRDELIEAFAAAGPVVDAKVPTDRETGRPRGFAFVEFENEDGARRCIEQMNGQDLKGRPLRVNEAENRPPRPTGEAGASSRAPAPGPPRGGTRRSGGGGGGYSRPSPGYRSGSPAGRVHPRSRWTRAGATSASARSPPVARGRRTRDGAATRSSTTKTTEPGPLRRRRRRPARPLSPGSATKAVASATNRDRMPTAATIRIGRTSTSIWRPDPASDTRDQCDRRRSETGSGRRSRRPGRSLPQASARRAS